MDSPSSQESIEIRVDGDFDACSAWWHDLQRSAVASPYQRHCWTRAWWEHFETHNRCNLRIVSLFRRGEPLVVMPLVLERRLGLNVACPVGAGHFNWQIPLWNSVAVARLAA